LSVKKYFKVIFRKEKKMKSKSGNYKLIYQNLKKRREKNKSNSLKGSEDMNDDSLDYK
jgi:hypothetical protein